MEDFFVYFDPLPGLELGCFTLAAREIALIFFLTVANLSLIHI